MMHIQSYPVPSQLWLAIDPSKGSPGPIQQEEAPDTKATGLRVLIVEDEFYIALDIEALLGALGHTPVGIAVSADEAVRIAEKERPDVVLMDIRLAGTRDGIDAAQEIHTRFGIRSLFVTANTDPQTRYRAAAVNPIGFLEKPLNLQRLQAALNT